MKKLAFNNVEKISDVAEVIQKKISTIEPIPSSDIMIHYENLINLPLEDRNQFLDFVHYVDESFSSYGYYSFLGQKILTILAGATYYKEYYEDIKDLNVQEVAILAKYSVIDPISEYSLNIQKFPKEILDVVSKKTKDFIMRDELMMFINLSDRENKNTGELCMKIQKTSLQDLTEESYKLQEQLLEERGFHDSRRI